MYLDIDSEEYWENPARLSKLERPSNFARTDAPSSAALELLSKVRATHFVLGDPEDDSAPAAVVLRLPPMFPLPYHAHDSNVFMVVISGSLYVPGKVLRPGDAQVAPANEFYGPEVAGPEGCVRVEFFSELHGSTDVQYQLEDGSTYTWQSLSDEPGPGLGMDGVPELISKIKADMAANAS